MTFAVDTSSVDDDKGVPLFQSKREAATLASELE